MFFIGKSHILPLRCIRPNVSALRCQAKHAGPHLLPAAISPGLKAAALHFLKNLIRGGILDADIMLRGVIHIARGMLPILLGEPLLHGHLVLAQYRPARFPDQGLQFPLCS